MDLWLLAALHLNFWLLLLLVVHATQCPVDKSLEAIVNNFLDRFVNLAFGLFESLCEVVHSLLVGLDRFCRRSWWRNRECGAAERSKWESRNVRTPRDNDPRPDCSPHRLLATMETIPNSLQPQQDDDIPNRRADATLETYLADGAANRGQKELTPQESEGKLFGHVLDTGGVKGDMGPSQERLSLETSNGSVVQEAVESMSERFQAKQEWETLNSISPVPHDSPRLTCDGNPPNGLAGLGLTMMKAEVPHTSRTPLLSSALPSSLPPTFANVPTGQQEEEEDSEWFNDWRRRRRALFRPNHSDGELRG